MGDYRPRTTTKYNRQKERDEEREGGEGEQQSKAIKIMIRFPSLHPPLATLYFISTTNVPVLLAKSSFSHFYSCLLVMQCKKQREREKMEEISKVRIVKIKSMIFQREKMSAFHQELITESAMWCFSEESILFSFFYSLIFLIKGAGFV